MFSVELIFLLPSSQGGSGHSAADIQPACTLSDDRFSKIKALAESIRATLPVQTDKDRNAKTCDDILLAEAEKEYRKYFPENAPQKTRKIAGVEVEGLAERLLQTVEFITPPSS